MSNSLINSTTQIDATLTKEGYAADSKAVGDKFNSIPEIEYGCYTYNGFISDIHSKEGFIPFTYAHNSPPKSVVISYRTYGYFYGALHLNTGLANAGTDSAGIYWIYIPVEIGNGQGLLLIDWVAIW